MPYTAVWPKGIQQNNGAQKHKHPGEGGEETIKLGTQLHFLLLGKVVASFAEPFEQARNRGVIPHSLTHILYCISVKC